jgi:hypothetical protein
MATQARAALGHSDTLTHSLTLTRFQSLACTHTRTLAGQVDLWNVLTVEYSPEFSIQIEGEVSGLACSHTSV